MNTPSSHRITELFKDSITTLEHCSTRLAPLIAQAGDSMVAALTSGHKILACGNGGSAADAMHFSAELLNRFVVEREPLPAIALTTDTGTITAIGNDYDFSEVFSKQVRALGKNGDMLLAISTSGNSANVIKAVEAAHNKNMQVITLTGKSGGQLSGMIHTTDINICVPSTVTARIQEVHGLAIHGLCEIIDQHFASNQEIP